VEEICGEIQSKRQKKKNVAGINNEEETDKKPQLKKC
jgi:hypothetical protein